MREDRKGPEGAISPAVPTIPGTLEAGIVFKLKPGLGTPEGAGGDSSCGWLGLLGPDGACRTVTGGGILPFTRGS